MVTVAKKKDLVSCQELLSQLSSSDKFSGEYLYIPETKNGFTVLVHKNNNPIGMSTFSLRVKKINQRYIRALFWENLIVDKDVRDGQAYLELILFLRRLIRNDEFQEIYLIAHRQKALNAHKSASFKEIGYINILFSNFQLHIRQSVTKDIDVLTYQEFREEIQKKYSSKFFTIKKFLEDYELSYEQISRQLTGKNGLIFINYKEKNFVFARVLFQFLFLQINLILGDRNDVNLLRYSKGFKLYINLVLKKSSTEERSLLTLRRYSILSFCDSLNLDSVKFWENDAW